MENKRMPIGVDDFAEIITQGFYYVDKTEMIKDLLNSWGKVNLFTRPRRFGKSINMSMLRYFFEIGTDRSLFDGLKISEETVLCEKYQGQYPVISISLKQVAGATYDTAKLNMWEQISGVAGSVSYLYKSEKLSEIDKENLRSLQNGSGNLDASLKQISDMLFRHFGKKVIILIDEYDAPLQKAYENGYYNEMVKLIRQLFGYALKSNESLFFSVLTGCMRVSKESIFSDLNNPKLYTLLDERCEERFGFTDSEVMELLGLFGLSEYYETTKDWYDGYHIGNSSIYCPWDVINYCDQLLTSSDKAPRNYWANVSENGIVYQFVEMSDETTRADLEVLSEGGSVDKEISQELTYNNIGSSIDNLWSVLFTAGYLTQRGRNPDGTYKLAIPNREIRSIFNRQVRQWFLKKVDSGLDCFYKAFDEGNPEAIENSTNDCMRESISFMDGGNTEEQKESWYHALLVGMFISRGRWVVKSNREAGNGRADILLTDRTKRTGIIIEIKYAWKPATLEAKAAEGLKQIDDKKYDEYFDSEDITDITKYGIAFNRRTCKVAKK